ncbi:MAG: YihY/virulence factor BrkB family protein [Gammaproteobacteria bacterium]|nr:YihY/virulence factor BrkB family protein [Gammaproteobacteria bacterium]
MLTSFGKKLQDLLWDRPLESLPAWDRILTKTGRIAFVVIRDLGEGQLNLRAMSLVYTTLLSLVPLLAFSFSVLKGIGLADRLRPLLYESLTTLGPKGEELGDRIMGFIDNVRADVLGSVGLALLIYLIISLVQKVEASFNHVWRVQQPRSFARRFSDYLSVILIGPLLIALALGITGSASNATVVQKILAIEPFGTLILKASTLLPYLFVIAAFTFVYQFIPNTRVKLKPALIGAIVGGIVWQTAGWLFARFIASSTNYIAIYSSFAIVLIFMIWLYLSWLILLSGAQVAFYAQNPRFIMKSRSRLMLSNALREQLALEVMYQVGKRFHDRKTLLTMDSLTEHLRIPGDSIASITSRLERAGLLLVTDADVPEFIPGTDLDVITVIDILAAVRRTDPELDHDDGSVPKSQAVGKVLDALESDAIELLKGKTLRDLVDSEERN